MKEKLENVVGIDSIAEKNAATRAFCIQLENEKPPSHNGGMVALNLQPFLPVNLDPEVAMQPTSH